MRHIPRPSASKGIPEAPSSRFGLLISIQPRFAEAILEGTKTVELRRRPPRDRPDVVIIYSSGTSRSVVGVAQLRGVHTSSPAEIWRRFGRRAGVSRTEFDEYFAGSDSASAIQLRRPERAEVSMPLESLREYGLEPPQSWRYLDEGSVAAIVTALTSRSVGPRLSSRGRRTGCQVASSLVDLAWAGLSPVAGPLGFASGFDRCSPRRRGGVGAELLARRATRPPADQV